MSRKTTGYYFEHQFRSHISESIEECPDQTLSIILAIDKSKSKDVGTLQFTEEVKDGRTPKFNIQKPLTLKGFVVACHDIKLIITHIEYVSTNTVGSEYSEYRIYSYHMVFDLHFINENQISNEDIAHLTFQIHNS